MSDFNAIWICFKSAKEFSFSVIFLSQSDFSSFSFSRLDFASAFLLSASESNFRAFSRFADASALFSARLFFSISRFSSSIFLLLISILFLLMNWYSKISERSVFVLTCLSYSRVFSSICSSTVFRILMFSNISRASSYSFFCSRKSSSEWTGISAKTESCKNLSTFRSGSNAVIFKSFSRNFLASPRIPRTRFTCSTALSRPKNSPAFIGTPFTVRLFRAVVIKRFSFKASLS